MNRLYDFVKNVLNNQKWVCNLCGNENFVDNYYCPTCLKSFEVINENKCNHCGRSTMYPTLYCDSCKEINIDFDLARSCYEYVSPMDKLIKNIKYNNKTYLLEDFACKLKEIYVKEFLDADYIVYVPMTKTHKKERGFNQGEILAKNLSKLINVEVADKIYKVKDTERQAVLDRNERIKNVKNSFMVDKKFFMGKNVLIVDDVLTTGATTNELSKILKKYGANKVYVLTIASVGYINKKMVKS